MSWIRVRDWKPPFGIFVEVSDTVHGERHIAKLVQRAHNGSYAEIWEDRYGNVVWPSHWSLLREGPSYFVEED